MKITTIYRETLTITTDDAGARTIERSSHAQTLREYYFTELTAEAQQRAIDDAIEEEQRAYYESGNPYASHTGTDIDEIWFAYRDFAKHQPIDYRDNYTSFYLTVRDAERVTPEEDTGICWSMDMCDAWNKYAAAVPMLIEEAEEHEARAYEIEDAYSWPTYTPGPVAESVTIWTDAHERHADRCRAKAEELAEQAKDALEATMHRLINEVEEYYQSAEFWREWFNDCETRFARDGARI